MDAIEIGDRLQNDRLSTTDPAIITMAQHHLAQRIVASLMLHTPAGPHTCDCGAKVYLPGPDPYTTRQHQNEAIATEVGLPLSYLNDIGEIPIQEQQHPDWIYDVLARTVHHALQRAQYLAKNAGLRELRAAFPPPDGIGGPKPLGDGRTRETTWKEMIAAGRLLRSCQLRERDRGSHELAEEIEAARWNILRTVETQEDWDRDIDSVYEELDADEAAITSYLTPHYATPSNGGWRVTWLPNHILDHATAMTAIAMAAHVAKCDGEYDHHDQIVLARLADQLNWRTLSERYPHPHGDAADADQQIRDTLPSARLVP